MCFKVKLLLILTLCTVYVTSLPFIPNENMIYKRYERKHATKDFIEIVEIFKTNKMPTYDINDDVAINNFLAIDLFNKQFGSTTSTTETIRIPTTWRPFPQTTTTERPFYRSTRPTIKPNPKENQNPDYTDILEPIKDKNESSKVPQTTKRTDDEDTTNKNVLTNIYDDYEMETVESITENEQEIKGKNQEDIEEDEDDEEYDEDYYINKKFDLVEGM